MSVCPGLFWAWARRHELCGVSYVSSYVEDNVHTCSAVHGVSGWLFGEILERHFLSV